MQLSYDYQLLKRDLGDLLSLMIQAEPTLISLIANGPPATQTKHEWLHDVQMAETDAVNGAVLIGATTITVDDGTKFQAGMLLAVEGSDEVIKVTSVATNDLTVVRGYGGSTAAAITDNTEIKIVSKPRPEGTDPGDDPGTQPTTDFNYTEIFDFTAKVSKTSQAVQKYGISNALDRVVQHGAQAIARRMNNALIYGRRVQRSASENGSMGGVLQYCSRTVDAGAAALTDTILNNAIEEVVKVGGRPNVIVLNTNQSRKLSSLHGDKIQLTRQDQARGSAVYQFVNDLPMGIVNSLVLDINLPKNKVLLLDTTKINLVPLNGRGLGDEDATLPGADSVARRLLGEYTLEVKNGADAHTVITNLAL